MVKLDFYVSYALFEAKTQVSKCYVLTENKQREHTYIMYQYNVSPTWNICHRTAI